MLTVIGEALIDEVRRPGAEPEPHVGGSPMNVAVGLARLGHPVQFLGRYGRDEYGSLVAAHLHGNSVLLPLGADQWPTRVARARIDGTGAASYEFELTWQLPEIPAEQLQGSTLLHTGSIAAMLEPGADAVHRAVLAARGHATISYDPNCRPSIITDLAHARLWGLTETEWRRYQQLMQGIRGSIAGGDTGLGGRDCRQPDSWSGRTDHVGRRYRIPGLHVPDHAAGAGCSE